MSQEEKLNLKLICRNQDDLKVISAYLQDSIVTVQDIVFLRNNRTFIMIVNRFMWEDVEKGIFRHHKRIRCAVKFEDVIKVKSQKINQKNKNKPFEFLAIKSGPYSNETYKINIFFAGGGIITIISEAIEVFMSDLGKSWRVQHVPQHKI